MTLDEAKDYLKIDYADEDSLIADFIETSQIYIDSCVGEAYKTDDKLVKLSSLAQYKIINDLYNNRQSTEIKPDKIIETIFTLLSLGA